MDFEKFDRQLRLMILLTQNTDYSVDDICEKLSMSRRTIYRYLEAFRQMGFIVKKESNIYRLDKDSPFFEEISTMVHFTEDEAATINQVLNSVHNNSQQVRALRWKLSRLYDYKVLSAHSVNERMARNIHELYEAIKQERVVILKDYNSPHSNQESSRVVEPYMFHEGNTEIRCYEIASGMNKTFKVSRIGKVEMMDILWNNKDKHAPYHTDLFHFSGEKTYPVTLRLGRLATSLIMEEYPDATRLLKLENDGRCLLSTEVCSYKGVARFVMGLIDDIEIVDSPEFVNYLRERAQYLTSALGD